MLSNPLLYPAKKVCKNGNAKVAFGKKIEFDIKVVDIVENIAR